MWPKKTGKIKNLPGLFNIEPSSKIVDHAQGQGTGRRKGAAYDKYVSILRRSVTQLLSVRRIFEVGST